MKEVHSQNCPLCSNPAEYEFSDYENRKHFLCANCTEFQISVRSEFRVAKGPTAWRTGLAKTAREHPEGTMLVITLPSGQREDDVSYSALSAEYVKKSDLPK